MFASLLSALISSGLSFILKLFGKNRDEEIGALREVNKDQAEVLSDAAKANEIDNRVVNMSDHARNRLSALLNKRD